MLLAFNKLCPQEAYFNPMAGQLYMGYEENMSFLVIPKSLKVEKIGLGSFNTFVDPRGQVFLTDHASWYMGINGIFDFIFKLSVHVINRAK